MAETISYPGSSGFLVSGWAPGETLGNWNFIAGRIFAVNSATCHGAANHKNIYFSNSPDDQPLAKEPEDSGYEIVAETVSRDILGFHMTS